jgi:hypothetical protein
MSIILDALKKTQEKMASPVYVETLQEEKLHADEEREQLHKQHEQHTYDHRESAVHQRYKKYARKEPLESPSTFPWKMAGLASLVGLAIVVFVGGASVFDFRFEQKAKTDLVSNQHPTLPIVVSAPADLVLNGTMLEGRHRIAVINDKSYTVGDHIDNKIITAILMDKVILQDGKSTMELKAKA